MEVISWAILNDVNTPLWRQFWGERPMKVVNVHEAKTNFSRLLDRAHAGEEIILAKAGRPYARLVPLEKREPRTPGRYPASVPGSFFEPLGDEELDAWEA
jgi:prevent-host-death family protein